MLSDLTTALTLKDGSQIEEIRSNPNKITSDVTNDGGSSFIRLSNTKGDVVRLVKTMDTVSISNRDISSTISAFSAPVNCIRHPNAFLDLTAFLDLFNDNGAFNQPTNTFPIFARYFSSFAQNTKRIGLCW